MTIKQLYVSEDIKNDEVDFSGMDTEVIVVLSNGKKYRAHFTVMRKLAAEVEKKQQDSQEVAQKYYWCKDRVIVNKISRKDLHPIVEHMMDEGDFQMIFEKL